MQVRLAPAHATDEKYALFRAYQAAVHRESPSEISSREGWQRFLVDAPFPVCPQAYTQEPPNGVDRVLHYGLYHQEYRCTSPAQLTQTAATLWP